MLPALICFVIVLAAGFPFLQRLQLQPGDKVFPAFAVGSFLAGISGFILSQLGQFHTVGAYSILLALAMLGAITWRAAVADVAALGRWLCEALCARGNWGIPFAVFVGVYLLLLILVTDTPARSGDAMKYHLAQLKDMVMHGGDVYRPYLHYQFPQYFSLVFFPAYVMAGGTAMKFASLINYLFVIVAMVRIADRLGAKNLRLIVLLFAMMPQTINGASIVTNDWAVCLYGLTAFMVMLTLVDSRQMQFAPLAYLCLGVAMGTKYHFVLLVPWLVVLHWHHCDGEPRARIVRIATGLTTMGLVGFPFYLRNFLRLGNPVWPLLQGLVPPPNPAMAEIATTYVDNMSGTHSLAAVISTLLTIAKSPYMPVTVWMLGITAVVATRTRLLIGTGCLLFFGFWWVIQPTYYWRFAIYMLPFTMVALGLYLDQLDARGDWRRRAAHAVIAVSVSYGFAVGMYYIKDPMAWYTTEGRANYHYATWYYDEFNWINTNLPEDSKIMLLVGAGQSYYLDREYVRADPRMSAAVDWDAVRSLEELRGVIREHEVDYIFFSPNGLRPARKHVHVRPLIESAVDATWTETVWVRKDIRLYTSRMLDGFKTEDATLLRVLDEPPPDA